MSSQKPLPDRRRAWIEIVAFGVACGLLVALLRLAELRFLVVERAFEVYAGLIAVLFTGVGLWLGRSLRRRRAPEAPEPATGGAPFKADEARREALGITPRELEVLDLIARGLSNREIAERLFISENTVKTHSRRLFDKLGARRRTQAVRLGRSQRLIS